MTEKNIPSVCPECGGALQERNGRYGKFLGCSNYPNCKYIFNIVDIVKIRCPECKRQLNWRKGKFGWFLSCTGYPECKFAFTPYKDQKEVVNCPECEEKLNYIEEGDIPYLKCPECGYNLEVKIDKLPKCPTCGSRLRKRQGKEGFFLGCSKFPECRYTFGFEREEINLTCPECGKPLDIREGKYGKFAGCTGFPDCNYVFDLRS